MKIHHFAVCLFILLTVLGIAGYEGTEAKMDKATAIDKERIMCSEHPLYYICRVRKQ